MLISSWLGSVQSRLRYGRRLRLRRTDVSKRDRKSEAEKLEERALLTPQLVAIQPNDDVFWFPNDSAVNSLDVAPDQLRLQFGAGDDITVQSLIDGGVEFLASGNDGTFGDGNERVITPGYIGTGQTPNEVLIRFSETLEDDFYQITAFGTGADPITNAAGEVLNGGASDTLVNFQLDLGAKITAVVPQPVTRDSNDDLTQALDQIVVYFNDDDLDPVSAEDSRFYRLIYTSESISSVDDLANQHVPIDVDYDPVLNTATLTFSSDINQLSPLGGGSFRLRIGTDEQIPVAPVTANVGADPGSAFRTANTQVGDLAQPGNTSHILSAGIEAQAYDIQFPGANDEPGHREIEAETHLLNGPDTVGGVTQLTYNFETNYGFDPQGNPLTNIITEEQKERAREVFEFYSEQTGLDFLETGDGQPVDLIIVTGDLRALDPNIPTGPGGVAGLAGGGIAIMDAAETWTNQPGGSWFDVALHEIGHLLGLGHTFELAPNTIQGDEGGAGNGLSEERYPGQHDLTHLQHLHRPDSIDVDLYQFQVSSQGTFSAETIAERATSASTLDSHLRLFQELPDGSRQLIAQNDDYFSEDSFIEIDLQPGTYFIGVSSTGNDDYDPAIENTGFNGTSDGVYDLRLDFRPSALDSILDVDDTVGDEAPSAFDGDSDGVEGGVFNFWFNAFDQTDVIFVDRTAAPGGDGSIATPFNEIDVALTEATVRQQANEAASLPDLRQVVRIVGNVGADGLLSTPEDAESYEIGVDTNNVPLRDGANLAVPKGVTVMVDEGAVLKFRRSRVQVGSTLATVDRSASALQILGTPFNDVTLTSWNNEGLGGDTTANLTSPTPGDWGGIAFQNDVDYRSTSFNYQREGIFLNYVNHADITYGGGTVLVDSALQIVNPIHMTRSRPTLSYNTISRSADSALSADPNSFEESRFTTPEFQRGSSFSLGYDRVGPDIHDNILVDNSTNGLFVRVVTPAGDVRQELTVPGRFDDRDITHVITETLQISGTPGGQFRETEAPPLDVTFVTDNGSGSLVGSFNYRLVFVTENGFEGPASIVTNTVTSTNGGLTLNGLPQADLPFTGRRLYRSEPGGAGPYTLIAQLDAAGTTFVDNGSTLVGQLDPQTEVLLARTDARLSIDPGVVVKMRGANIEVENSAQLIAEGAVGQEIIFTSLLDDRFGRGGTFDTNNDDAMEADPSPGDWGGLYAGNLSSLSLDYAYVAFGGGVTPVGGSFAGFNAVELHQATGRITNSEFESNADGRDAPGGTRSGLGSNNSATIFIRNSQPIIVNNVIRDNEAGLSINANALTHELVRDVGRSTGSANLITAYSENFGPLIRENTVDRNGVSGLEVRAETLTAESVWDDADIVHVVRNEIYVPDFHTFGGLRLQSTPDSSLVIKFDGPNAGFTANGRPLDISDRIGGMLHVVGQPGNPVVMTSLADDTVGAGFDLEGLPHFDTNNDGIDADGDGFDDDDGRPVNPAVPQPGDWRGLLIDEFASDRNVAIYVENETNVEESLETNNEVLNAESLGELASNENSSDENLRVGFEVHGNIKRTGDLDVYSFAATAGTEVWVDIDFSRHAFDPVVELLDPAGNIVAISDNSIDETAGTPFLIEGAVVNPMERSPLISFDNYTTNQRDAGFRVVLPGNPGFSQQYFVRVRSSSIDSLDLGANRADLADLNNEGLTTGSYQLQVRINEIDEQPGTTVRFSDIRYATDGIEIKGQPAHSPLTGEFREVGDVGAAPGSVQLGNLLNTDRAVLSIAGNIQDPGDVDTYTFEVEYDSTQNISDVSNPNQQVPVIFDLDYADGLSRANTVLSVFDEAGSLVWISRDSNITDDQGGPLEGSDIDDLTRGSAGVLDPFIGPVELPVGTYHLAVTSNDQLPSALDQYTVANAADTQIRLEPNNAVTRIAEEHFTDGLFTTATGPIVDLFDNVAAQAVPWHLGDVTLYVATTTGVVGGNNIAVQQVNPFTGSGVAKLSDVNQPIGDIVLRDDGELFAFSLGPNAGAGTDANTGNYLNIDVNTGAVTNVGDDGVTTWHDEFNNAGNLVTVGTDEGYDYEAILYTGTGANNGFAIGSRTPIGVTGPEYVDNVLYQFNITNGAVVGNGANRAGDDRVEGAGTQLVEVGVFEDAAGNSTVDGEITGLAQLANGSTFAVTDAGSLYQITTNANVIAGPFAIPGGNGFEGLSAGPENVENGLYANTLFGITGGGTLIAFDATGNLEPIFLDGESSVETNLGGVRGLDFSTLDRNLWNVTDERTGTIFQAPDDSRRQVTGGDSLYFGNDVGAVDAGNRNNLDDDAINNVNFPGGAHGGIVSNEFSLEGYAAADNPVLYFDYFLDTEDTPFQQQPQVLTRDSFRVYVGSDTTQFGVSSWSLVATNNQFQDPDDPDEFDIAPDGSFGTTFPSAQTYPDVQPLLETPGNTEWRQVRIDLSSFAGQDNLRLRFEFSTAGSVGVGTAHVGEELRALPGSELHDGQFFVVDGVFFEFDMGYSLITPSGAAVTDSETFTINGQAFEMDSDGTTFGGATAIPFTTAMTPAQVAQSIQAVLNANGISSVIDDNRVNITEAGVNLVQSLGTSVTLEGAPGGFGGQLIPINANSSREFVATQIQTALANEFANGETDVIKTGGDLVRIIGHNVDFAGPLPFTSILPGDEAFASFTNRQRIADNDVEGVYVDNIIIGFAERGEMVVNAAANTGFTQNREINNPNNVDTNLYQDILVGPYDVEIRRGTTFGHGETDIAFPFLVLNTDFDTNTRFVDRLSLIAPEAQDIADGQTFTLSDGDTVLTFEFEDVQLGNGVAAGNVAVPFDPQAAEIGGQGAASDFSVAQAIRDAINSPAAQGNFDLAASTGDGADTGTASTSNVIAIAGVSLFDPGDSAVTSTRVERIDAFGDDNVHREQGQILIESNVVTNSLNFGINVGPGDRVVSNADGAGVLAHSGPTRNLQNLNVANEVPGVVILNNVVAYNEVGGIRFAGDPGADAPAPYGRIVNNTVYGSLDQDAGGNAVVGSGTGIGIDIADGATPTLLNNIVAAFGTGIRVGGGASAVIGGTVFKDNSTNSTVGPGQFSITIPNGGPQGGALFVDEFDRNFYLAPTSLAIDSSLDTLADRTSIVNVKSPLGISPSPIKSPSLDVFGQLRGDDPDVSPPAGLGANVFKDRGAIDRVDFEGPFAFLATPEDEGLDDLLLNVFNVVWNDDPTQLRAFVLQLFDAGIGVDDRQISTEQFELFQDGELLVEDVDYRFIYNSTTDEVFFASLTQFDTDARYEIVVDNDDDMDDGLRGVRDLAGNYLEPNQADGSAVYGILLTDTVNDAPIHDVPDTSVTPIEVNEDTPLVFDATTTLLTVDDADANVGDINQFLLDPTNVFNLGPGTLTMTLTATNGVLSLGDPAAVDFTVGHAVGDGVDDVTMTFDGTLVDLNAAIAGLTFTPDPDYFGPASITLTTNDNGNFTAPDPLTGLPQAAEEETVTININVLPINDAPRFTLAGDVDRGEDAGVVSIPGFATISAVETGDLITDVDVTWTLDLPSDFDPANFFVIEPEIDLAGNLRFQTSPDVNGSVEVTVVITDDGVASPAPNSNISDPQTFKINIGAVNDAPEFDIPAQAPASLEDAGLQIVPGFATNMTTGPATALDELAQQTLVGFNLSVLQVIEGNITFVSGPSIDLATGDLTYEVAPDTAGTAQITVTLEDDGSGVLPDVNVFSRAFNIVVDEVNDPPTFGTVTDLVVDEDAGLQTVSNFATPISAGTANEDASGQTVSFRTTIVSSTGTLTFDAGPTIDSNGQLTYTPTADTNGVATIEVVAIDNGGGDDTSVAQTFTITVNAINDAPTATVPVNAPDSYEDSGRRFIGSFLTDISPGPIDESGQTVVVTNLNISVTSGNLAFSEQPTVDPITGDLSYRAAANTWGTADISFNLLDDGQATTPHSNTSVLYTFELTVLQVSNPASLEGRKFNDLNADGVLDAGEPFLNGWSIEIFNDLGFLITTLVTTDRDLDGNGVIDPATETGWYVWDQAAPIEHTFAEIDQADWAQSFPVNQAPHVITPALGQVTDDLNFGNFIPATVEGRKFHDVNGNGVFDSADDTYLNGWVIDLLDSAGNIVLDLNGNPISVTTADFDSDGDGVTEPGWYLIEDIIPGDYIIREQQQDGWGSSLPFTGEYVETLTSAEDFRADFGNFIYSTVTGNKFHDRNGNGTLEVGEEYLDGWTIELVDNVTSTVVMSTTTASVDRDSDGAIVGDEVGYYEFTNVRPGDYSIREIIPSPTTSVRWAASTPTGGLTNQVIVSDDDIVLDFGNYQLSTISGRKFLDENVDGVRQPNEDWLNGWVIDLIDVTGTVVATDTTRGIDANGNGTIEAAEQGWYVFDTVSPGIYTVAERLIPGWKQTAPASGTWSVAVSSGDVQADRDFGNFAPGEITGRKLHDLNANAQTDANEPFLDGWQIQLWDRTGTILLRTTETTSIDLDDDGVISSNETGIYILDDLNPGEYIVREEIPDGWVQSVPGGSFEYEVSIGNGSSISGIDFANYQTATISGDKFHDANANGVRESDEPTLSGFRIELVSPAGVQTVTTGADGSYSFEGLTPGVYTVREPVQGGGWVQSAPVNNGTYVITLNSGSDEVGNDFGNFQPATVQGRKFEDVNGNGAFDEGEPFLNGWDISLYLATDTARANPIATVTTFDWDRNGNGQIEPETERGWYRFDRIVAGDYALLEEDPTVNGFVQSLPAGNGEYALSLQPLQFETDLNFGNYREGAIRGRKWHDLNGDGIRSSNEEYLNGWTIELVDQAGGVLTQTTQDIDLNGDGTIDPETERGWYTFTNLTPGDWTIREILFDGWSGTVPVGGAVAEEAFDLDQEFEFFDDGTEPLTAQFIELRWFRSATDNNDWYFLTEGGQVFEWDAVPGSQTGDLIASLNPAYFANPALLTDAQPSAERPISVSSGESLQNVDFGNYEDASISGVKFHDINSNGLQDANEALLPGWTIELRTSSGALVESTVTDADGAYSFENILPGDYFVTEIVQDGWVRSAPSLGEIPEVAFQLDQTFGFFFTGNLFENAYGAGEKWFRASEEVDRWFYILPNGEVYRWSEIVGSATGTLVGTLDSTYSDDPSLIYDAVHPGVFNLSIISGDDFASSDFGNYQLDGSVEGVKFHDRDADGVRDANDEGLNGWVITITDADGTTIGTATTATVTVDGVSRTGYYSFDDLAPGTYTITETAQSGWSIAEPRTITVEPGQSEFNADFGNYQFASISGRKFHDVNANGTREADEPYLNGWTVTAIDDAGNELGSAVTGNVDLNGDGTIDPETETGLYTVTGLAPGEYTVRETLQPGWFQSAPVSDQFTDIAADLDERFDLNVGSNLFEDWGGLNERWLQGAGGTWFYILPNGEFYLWDGVSGQSGEGLEGSLQTTFSSTYYDNVNLIASPLNTQVLLGSGETATGFNFGNYQAAEVRGRVWRDIDNNGLFDAGENYQTNWSVRLLDANGEVVATTLTGNLDVNGDGTIDAADDTGWYQFAGLRPGEYFVESELPGNWIQSGAIQYTPNASGSFDVTNIIPGFSDNAFEAYRLDQEFEFITTGNDWFDWGSEQERWVFSQRTNSWAYVTQAGSVFEWDGISGRGGATPLNGELIAELDSDYYERLDLLFEPVAPSVEVLSGRVNRAFDFGNFLDGI